MTHIGIPLLSLGPDLTWCTASILREHSLRWRHPSGSAGMADKKFIDEVVKAHNEYRKHHQAAPLSHAKDLSAQAQKWADHLAAAGSFQHSSASLKGERLGENIAMKWSSRPDAYSGQEVTDQWYSEVKMYQFGGEPRTLSSGHFTQVVWKASKEIGVGRAVTSDGKVIVVANYRPAGNMMGSFGANVLAPKDGKITLPPDPDSSPSAITSRLNQDNDGAFSQRFDELRKGMFSRNYQQQREFNQTSESKSIRTYTVTEGIGSNKVTKTVTEETIIKANGEKIVNKTEKTLAGDGSPKQSTHLNATTSSNDSSYDRGAPKTMPSKPQKMGDFQQDCLKAHNAKRALHGTPPLKLANDLSKHSQQWAEHLASKNSMEHSKCMVNSERVGENVASKWASGAGADYSGAEPVDQWYSEIQKHDFSSDRGTSGTGHFTQVVWRGSRELGVGKATNAKGTCIVVCNYRPSGNLIGTFKENVPRPIR